MTHPSGEAVKTEETVIMNIEEDQKDTDDKSHSTGDKEVIESTVEKEDSKTPKSETPEEPRRGWPSSLPKKGSLPQTGVYIGRSFGPFYSP